MYGVTRGVCARGQDILTAPPNLLFSVTKPMTFLVVNRYASQFGTPFPQLLTKLPLKPNLWTILPPKYINIYIPVSSFCAPFFTCARGQPPSPVPPRYATGYIHY